MLLADSQRPLAIVRHSNRQWCMSAVANRTLIGSHQLTDERRARLEVHNTSGALGVQSASLPVFGVDRGCFSLPLLLSPLPM